MKKILSVILVILLAASVFGCGKLIGKAPEVTVEPAVTEAPAATEVPVPKVEVTHNDIVIGNKGLYENSEDHDGEIVVNYPILKAPNSEALNTALETVNEQLRTEAEATLESLKEHQFVDDCYSKTVASVIRSDSLVTSILFINDYYAGGTHPWRTYTAKTFDTATGKELALSDVVTDEAAMKQKVTDEIKAYAEEIDESFIPDAEPNPTWVVGYDGLVMYINAGDVLSYAASDIILDYSFKNYGSLLNQLYSNVPESRTMNMALDTIYVVGQEANPYLGVSGIESVDEDGNVIPEVYEKIYISYAGRNTTLEDAYCYYIKPYAVHTPDGNFLYIITSSDNDVETTYVYRLKASGPEYVDKLDFTGLCGGIQVSEDVWGQVENFDSQNFVLAKRMDTLSTGTGTKTVRVGSNGMPEAKDELFTLDPFQLTLKRKMTFPVIDPATGEEKEAKEYLKKSVLTVFRTDGETFVDATDEEGNTVRIAFEMEFPQKVDGKDAEDVFDGIFYAG